MATCRNCGKQFDDSLKECPACHTVRNFFAEKVERKINEGVDATDKFDQKDITENTLMGVLCYLSILVLIPIFAAKDSRYVRFHANQGLILCILEIVISAVLSIVAMILGLVWNPLGMVIHILTILVNLVFLLLSIVGIINVVNGKAKELPFIGGFTLLH